MLTNTYENCYRYIFNFNYWLSLLQLLFTITYSSCWTWTENTAYQWIYTGPILAINLVRLNLELHFSMRIYVNDVKLGVYFKADILSCNDEQICGSSLN
jgi:hypothetical protein